MTLTGHAESGSFGSQVNLSLTIREEREADSASVGTEAGRACLRATTRASDGRHGFGEGSTRSEKAQGESASSALKRRRSSGAPERDRPKLTTANSFVDSPPSWPREWPGSQAGTPEMITTMAQMGDGPLTQRPTRRPPSRNRALRRSLTESERQMGRPGDRLPLLLFVPWRVALRSEVTPRARDT